MGIPVGLVLANHFGWHAPFWMIVGWVSRSVLRCFYMQPVSSHLAYRSEKHPFLHLAQTVTRKKLFAGLFRHHFTGHRRFYANALQQRICHSQHWPDHGAIAGSIQCHRPLLDHSGPHIGKFSDIYGRYRTFLIGSVITTLMVFVYTNLGVTPLYTLSSSSIFFFSWGYYRGGSHPQP